MLRRFSDFQNMRLRADDRQVGRISDLLIEDNLWYVRYLVVSVDNTNRKVLISPCVIEDIDPDRNLVACALTSQRVIESPPVDLDQPISRQYEKALVNFYGWPIYWLGRLVHSSRQAMERLANNSTDSFVNKNGSNSQLRSAAELCRYQILSNSGNAGYLKDLVVQTATWRVEYATAVPNSWLPKEDGLVSSRWIKQVDWTKKRVDIDLSNMAFEDRSNESRQVPPAMT
jgi:hypothetical protein